MSEPRSAPQEAPTPDRPSQGGLVQGAVVPPGEAHDLPERLHDAARLRLRLAPTLQLKQDPLFTFQKSEFDPPE